MGRRGAVLLGEPESLKDWRNDIVGHFRDGAAEYAIDNVHSDAVGTIEIYRRDPAPTSRSVRV